MDRMETRKIRAGSGVSFQFHNMWYKLYYEEEEEVTYPFTMDRSKLEEFVDEHRKALWKRVNGQVDGQVQEILDTDKEAN
jgi:hypothetical protein